MNFMLWKSYYEIKRMFRIETCKVRNDYFFKKCFSCLDLKRRNIINTFLFSMICVNKINILLIIEYQYKLVSTLVQVGHHPY